MHRRGRRGYGCYIKLECEINTFGAHPEQATAVVDIVSRTAARLMARYDG